MFLIIMALFQLLVVGITVNMAEAMVNSAPGAPVRFRDGLRDYWRYYLPIGLVSALGVAAPCLPAWVSIIVVVGFIAAIAYMAYLWYDAGSRFGEGVCFTVFGFLMSTSMGSPLTMAGASLNGWFWPALLAFVWGIYLFRRFLPGRLWPQRITAILTGGVAAILAAAMLFGMVGDTIDNARAVAATRAAVAAQAKEQDEPDPAGAEEAAESGGVGGWLATHNPFAGLLGGSSESDDEAALQSSAEPDDEATADADDWQTRQAHQGAAQGEANGAGMEPPSAADAAAAEPAPAPVTSAVPSDADLGLGGRGSVAELKAQIPDYCHFYNLDLQENDGPDDDLNFAPNPYTESWTVDDYDRDFRAHLYLDPAAAAANMGYADAMTGNRYMGQFYDEVGSSWAAAINLAKDRFMADNAVHRETVKQFFNFLNRGTASIRWAKEGEVQDIMYQNPFTVSGVPDVIVLETGSMAGLLLEYTIPIKGRNITISYRVGCGYQPVNPNHKANMEIPVTTAEKVYEGTGKAVPQSYKKTSTPAPSTKSTTPAASSSGSGSKPSPSSSSSGSGAKDPSKGTNAGANKSGSGSGRSTNSGTGSRTSTTDKPTNTTSGQTSKPAANANKPVDSGGQKTGKDSTTPSTAVPRAAVQNNGETGNARDGSAPIRTETPVAAPATTGGAPIVNSGSGGGANGHADLPED